MAKRRTLIIGTVLSAMLVTTLAVPVAAAKTKLAIVNGIPGKRVDVCVNGREVKSGLRYGKFVFKNTRTAKATVKFYKPDPRRCGGKLLAKKTSGLDDATWVVTRRHPLKIVVFDNEDLGEPTFGGDTVRFSYRHAADLGAVTFRADFDTPTPSPVVLADSATKGQQALTTRGTADRIIASAYVTQAGEDVVPASLRFFGPLRRVEYILVGTAIAKARLVVIDRKLAQAS